MRAICLLFAIGICFLDPAKATAKEYSEVNNQGTYIIRDENKIEISGKKTGFILLNIGRELAVKISDTAAVRRYSTILLPESFDPTYIFHNSASRNMNNCLSKLKVSNFDARIKKANGDTVEAEVIRSYNFIKSAEFRNEYEFYDQPQYDIKNLKPGDILLLNYSYEAPFAGNFEKLISMRLFFHGKDFKQNYSLTLSHEERLNVNVRYLNNAEPDSSVKINNEVKYYWTKTNLPGCIDEPGSRPYLTLPHIITTFKPVELLYTLPYSFEERYIPLYLLPVISRERSFMSFIISADQRVNTKQYSAIRKFVRGLTEDLEGDTTGYFKLAKVSNFIADEFSYKCDTNYFKRVDVYNERIGDFISKRVIREISRYNLYAAVLAELGYPFYTAYPVDKRVGEISDDYIRPMFDSDFFFAPIIKNNTIHLVYPKNERFGYYLSETPFYFEDVKARLVGVEDYRNSEEPLNNECRHIITPKSLLSSNERKNYIQVNIDIDSLSAEFNARISLSGQYSTLTRGVYQYGYKDNTINELYAKKINEISPGVRVLKTTVNNIEKIFPYKAEVKTQYSCDDILKTTGNGEYVLSLKSWFNHIIYENMDAGNRTLDFYPDFKGRDTYSYMIVFNKNVEIQDVPEKIEISNDFGDIIVEFETIQPNTLKITSMFQVTSEKVPAGNISAVKNIFDKVEELNHSVVKLKVAV